MKPIASLPSDSPTQSHIGARLAWPLLSPRSVSKKALAQEVAPISAPT
ncbi:MAG: hypothetical protein BWZ10_01153 [candidate division BRC1 bacterium ADurb.BinA364]|nr:MAG: hypothetical protein BWZ10_01153 [candidate division BRC1 bacterium ADurb.BinA364]